MNFVETLLVLLSNNVSGRTIGLFRNIAESSSHRRASLPQHFCQVSIVVGQ